MPPILSENRCLLIVFFNAAGCCHSQGREASKERPWLRRSHRKTIVWRTMTSPGYDFRRVCGRTEGLCLGAETHTPPTHTQTHIYTHTHTHTHTHTCACARKKGAFSVAHPVDAARTLQPQAYILGETWAGTGSAFKIKSADSQRAAPGAKTIPASVISVQLSTPGKDQP